MKGGGVGGGGTESKTQECGKKKVEVKDYAG